VVCSAALVDEVVVFWLEDLVVAWLLELVVFAVEEAGEEVADGVGDVESEPLDVGVLLAVVGVGVSDGDEEESEELELDVGVGVGVGVSDVDGLVEVDGGLEEEEAVGSADDDDGRGVDEDDGVLPWFPVAATTFALA